MLLVIDGNKASDILLLTLFVMMYDSESSEEGCNKEELLDKLALSSDSMVEELLRSDGLDFAFITPLILTYPKLRESLELLISYNLIKELDIADIDFLLAAQDRITETTFFNKQIFIAFGNKGN